MSSHVKIVSWNGDGPNYSITRTPNLYYYLYHNNVDIMFVDALKLKQGQTINVRGYQTHTKLRPNSRFGGVGVLIKHGIPHRQITLNT